MKLREILLGFIFFHPFGKLNWEENILPAPVLTINIGLLKYPIVQLELSFNDEYFYFGLLGFGVQYTWC